MAMIYKEGVKCIDGCGSTDITQEFGNNGIIYCTCNNCNKRFVVQVDGNDVIDRYLTARNKIFAKFEAAKYSDGNIEETRRMLENLAAEFPGIAEIDPIYYWDIIALITGNFEYSDAKLPRDIAAFEQAKKEHLNIETNGLYYIDGQDIIRHKTFDNRYEAYLREYNSGKSAHLTKKHKKKKAVIIACVTAVAAAAIGVGTFAIVYKPDLTNAESGVRAELDNSSFGLFGKFSAELKAAEHKGELKELDGVSEKFKAYDISFEKGGVAIEPKGDVRLSFPIEDGYYTERVVVYRLKDGKAETVESEFVGGSIMINSSDTGVYAIAELPYKYTFNVNNGGDNYSMALYHGGTESLPQEPQRVGYSFSGWYKDNALWSADGFAQCDTVLDAQWTANTYKVEFYADGSLYKTENFIYDSLVELPSVQSKQGYMTHWKDDSGVAVNSGAWQIAHDTKLNAVFEPIVYTVELSSDLFTPCCSAVSVGTTTIDVAYDSKFDDIMAPHFTAKLFRGYYSERNGGGVQYIDADGKGVREWDIASDTTLYAFFEDDEKYNDYIKISTLSELKTVADTNEHAQAKYLLMNDIDMKESEWTALPAFYGLFDGGYHRIYNFKIKDGRMSTIYNNEYDIGLFSYLGNSGIIKNLQVGEKGYTNRLERETSTEERSSGMIVGRSFGTIENCRVINCTAYVCARGYYSAEGSQTWSNLGGVCGTLCDGVIKGCLVDGCVLDTYAVTQKQGREAMARSGGIAAYVGHDNNNTKSETAGIYDCYVRNTACKAFGEALKGSLGNLTRAPFARSGGLVAESYEHIFKRCVVENTEVSSGITWSSYKYGDGNSFKGAMFGKATDNTYGELIAIKPQELQCAGNGDTIGMLLCENSYEEIVLRQFGTQACNDWLNVGGKIELAFYNK